MFAPLTNPDENLHRRQIASAANTALRGETSNTGTFSAPAGGVVYTLKDARLGVGKVLLLCPVNAEAAQAHWYIPAAMNGSADVHFIDPLTATAEFSYAIIGAGNTRGM